MRKIMLKKIMLIVFMLLALPLIAEANPIKYIPRAPTFIFVIDYSGSMGMQNTWGEVKIKEAKKILSEINSNLPPLNINIGLYTIAPFKEWVPIQKYSKNIISKAIKNISDDFPIFGRNTPLGDDLARLGKIIQKLSGDIRVIILTDGLKNIGNDPSKVVETLHNKYNACFYFIAVDKSKRGISLLQRLTRVENCGSLVMASTFKHKKGVIQYLKNVFYTEKTPKKTQGTPTPEKEKKVTSVIHPQKEMKIHFPIIHFAFDSYKLTEKAKVALQNVIKVLSQHPHLSILVAGYTCNIGPYGYNKVLSEKRAEAVANYLIQKGVSPKRIKIIGYGETRPKYSNKTAKGRSQNRRVEITIIP